MVCMKPALILAVSFSLSLGAQCFGQDTTKATFHVTSVRSEKAKDTETRCNDQCFGEKLTVEGYIQPNDKSGSINYVLECIEIFEQTEQTPIPHAVIACDRVHSHSDYVVELGSHFILFNTQRDKSSKATIVAYNIVSEKEVAKRAK